MTWREVCEKLIRLSDEVSTSYPSGPEQDYIDQASNNADRLARMILSMHAEDLEHHSAVDVERCFAAHWEKIEESGK